MTRFLSLLLFPAALVANTLTLSPTFTSCSVSFLSMIAGDAVLSYRAAGDAEWQPGFPPVYDATRQEYRGSIVRLDENTRYDVRLEVTGVDGLRASASGSTATWMSAPEVASIRKLSSFRRASGQGYDVVGVKGRPDGWIRIVGDVTVNGGDTSEAAITFDNCQYVILEGVSLTGGGQHGIMINASCSDVRIVNCDISQWGRVPVTQEPNGEYRDAADSHINHDAGIHIEEARNVVVERCYIHDPNGYTNPWSGTLRMGERHGQRFSRLHPKGPNGIYLRRAGGGTVIRYNDIVGSHEHRYNDPIETAPNGAVDGGFNRDADIYGNVLAFGEDDGIELDGGQCNVRFFDNRIEQVLCGISTAPNKKGPSYIFNNLVWNMGDSTGSVGAAVKNGGGREHSLGKQFFFHNTFISSGYGCMQAVGFGANTSERGLFQAHTRNNIFMMVANRHGARNDGPSIGDEFHLPTNSFDYDMIANATLPGGGGTIQAAPGNETHGVFAAPAFVDARHGVFTLAAADPGIDRGTIVPNFTSSYAGSAPDLGAIETGGSSLMPARPIALAADKYYIQLQPGRSQTIQLQAGKLDGEHTFAIRKSADMDWLTVEPATGRIRPNTTLSLRFRARKSDQVQKGMIFVRLEDGLSVPITVYGESLEPADRQPADDTRADRERAGPILRVMGAQGYRAFTLMHWEDGTIIDARGAHWSSFGWGRSIRHSTVNDTTRNNYPVQLGADWVGAYPARKDLYNDGRCPPPWPEKLTFLGGVIEGTQPMTATWKESKAANGGGITFNALNAIIDGMRIHNIHDPFVPLEGNNFTIKNCWVSYARDDAIENDGFASGVVDDCLFEDTYCFYSARNTAGGAGRASTPIDPSTGKHNGERGAQAEAPGGGAGSRVRIQNSLIALGNHPGANSVTNDTKSDNARGSAMVAGFGHFWKMGDSRNPTLDLVENVFYIPKPFPGCKPSRYDVMPKPAGRIEGNIVIWMGEGRYPFEHEGFTVLSGAEGQAYWDKVRGEWIARHPKVPRVKGDPGYDPKAHGAAEPPPPELWRIAQGGAGDRGASQFPDIAAPGKPGLKIEN